MKQLANRKNIIIGFVILASLMLLIKLAGLQLFDLSYRTQAKEAALYKLRQVPSRGMIIDRKGKLFVANTPSYDILATYNKIDPSMDTTKFCELLGITKEYFIATLNKDWKSVRFNKKVPFVFLPKLSPDRFAAFKEQIYKFPGFQAELRSTRAYPDSVGAHVLGYLNEADVREIELRPEEYAPGDFIGKSGLEKYYEDELRGKKGISYILKDVNGRKIESFDDGKLDSASTPGLEMRVTLDLELQKYAEKLIGNKRGSVVAIEPSTGEILAMVSAPTYDPNIVGTPQFDSIVNFDKLNKAGLNRAIKGQYPPGSIFKCLAGLIGLQRGVITADKGIYCGGGYPIGGGKIQKCHGHPQISNISQAIQYSCNSYFFDLMRKSVNFYGDEKPGEGLDTFVNYLRDFGLGSRLGVDIPSEDNGYIPDSKYYDHLYRREINGWRATYMLSIGIGQGELQLTVLQMANITAAIANRGYWIKPHLIKEFINSDRKIPAEYREKHIMRIDQQHYVPVIDGMEMAVRAGTATRAFLDDIIVCGKTGTSENNFGEDHSVFFAFAPRDNPKIAIAVFVENAGFGARYAVPIGSLMIEKYLTGTIRKPRQYLEDAMISKSLLLLPPQELALYEQ
jgi:penicillin-binding protein 2